MKVGGGTVIGRDRGENCKFSHKREMKVRSIKKEVYLGVELHPVSKT